MAVFFFISGYIIEKTSRIENTKDFFIFLKKKTIQLMLPFIMWQFIVRKFFFVTDWQMLTWSDIMDGFIHPSLWFLLTLYGYMFAFAGFRIIANLEIKRLHNKWGGVKIIYFLFIEFALFLAWKLTGDFRLATLYLPYFSAGIFLSTFNKEKWLGNKIMGTISLLIISLCTCFWISGATSITNIILKIFVSFAVIQLTYIICQINWNIKQDDFVRQCGICSLSIYVIHWTFLPMTPYSPLLPQNELYGLIITTLLGIIIAYACILINQLIGLLPIMRLLLLGQSK